MTDAPEGQAVFRYWLNLPVGVDRHNVPNLLRRVADALEDDAAHGLELVDIGFERWYQNADPGDDDYDLPVIRVYVASQKS